MNTTIKEYEDVIEYEKEKTGFWNASISITDGEGNEIDEFNPDYNDIIDLITDQMIDEDTLSSELMYGDDTLSWDIDGEFVLDGEDVPFYDLDDASKEEIAKKLYEGDFGGELCETEYKSYTVNITPAEFTRSDDDIKGQFTMTENPDLDNVAYPPETIDFYYDTITDNVAFGSLSNTLGEDEEFWLNNIQLDTFIKDAVAEYKKMENTSKKTLSQVKMTIAEKKTSTEHMDEKSKSNGR